MSARDAASPVPLTLSFSLIVMLLFAVSRAVTSYSLPSWPVAKVPNPLSVKNETKSPTLITLSARSTSSTDTEVAPEDAALETWFAPVIFCSYAVAVAHMETLRELPWAPAVLAAKGPTLPWPSLNDPR